MQDYFSACLPGWPKAIECFFNFVSELKTALGAPWNLAQIEQGNEIRRDCKKGMLQKIAEIVLKS